MRRSLAQREPCLHQQELIGVAAIVVVLPEGCKNDQHFGLGKPCRLSL